MASYFDQRKQRVKNQANVVGDVNFLAVDDQKALLAELRRLRAAVAGAAERGAIEPDLATDTEYQMAQAIDQASAPDAETGHIVDHLAQARSLLQTSTSAAGLVAALGQAVDAVQRLF